MSGEGIQAAKLQVSVESNALTVSGEVQQLNQSVATVGKEGTENLGKLSQGFNFMQSEVLPAIGIVTGFAASVKKAYEFGEEGAQLIQFSEESHRFAASMGADMDEIVAKVQKATLRMIDDDQIMATTTRAMLMGLGADAEQMANLAEVAAIRGRLVGESASEAFDSIVTGIGRLSSRMLTGMGIIIDEQSAYENYANVINKGADSLTEMEKRQALLNAVLEDGNKLLKEQGGLVETDATKYAQAMVAIDDSMDKIKEKFAPFWADVASGLAGILTYQDTVKGMITDATTSFIDQGASYDEYLNRTLQSEVTAGNFLQGQVDKYKRDLATLADLENAGKTDTLKYFNTKRDVDDMQFYVERLGIINKTSYEISQIPIDGWVKKWEDGQKALEGAKNAATSYSDVITSIGIEGKLRDIQQGFNSSVEDLNKSQAELDDQLKKGKISLDDYTKKTEENKQAHDDLKQSVNENVKAFIFEQASAGLTGDALYELAHTMGMLDEASYAAAKEQEILRQQFVAGTIKSDEYAQKNAELADAIASLQSKDITVTQTTIHEEIYIQRAMSQAQSNVDKYGQAIPHLANGMDVTVPSGYSNDNYLMQLNVQSGERVQVTPAGQTPLQNNHSGGDTINIYPANAAYSRSDLMRDIRQSRRSR